MFLSKSKNQRVLQESFNVGFFFVLSESWFLQILSPKNIKEKKTSIEEPLTLTHSLILRQSLS